MSESAGDESSREHTDIDGDAPAWVLLPPGNVPERWSARGQHVVLVPLLAEEAEAVLTGKPAVPALDERDGEIARLLTTGASLADIGRAVGLSPRGVQHRLVALRRRFGAGTTAELAAYLARYGIGMARKDNDSPQES